MKKLAIATAVAALMATPAAAQYVYAPHGYAPSHAYVQTPGPFGFGFGFSVGPRYTGYGYAPSYAPSATVTGPAYGYATSDEFRTYDPDPNVQMMIRREQLLGGNASS